MLRLLLRNKVSMLMLINIILFTPLVFHTTAQERTGTVSGRVVDIDGHPIPKLPIFIAPIAIEGDWAQTIHLPEDYSQIHLTQTDGIGQFAITGILEGSFYFGLLPFNIDELLRHNFEENLEDYLSWNPATYSPGYIETLMANNFGMVSDDFDSDFEIQLMRVHGLTFHPYGDFDGIAFGVNAGTHIKDVELIVNPRMKVQGRILFNDGTPLANTRVELRGGFRHEKGRGGTNGSPWIDENGNFVHYIDEKNHTGFYTFSVKYQELEVILDPIQLAPGDRLSNLTFTFDSEPIPPIPLPPKFKAETEDVESKQDPDSPQSRKSNDVWIVNPANGHAYKRVHCDTRDDAIAQASKEKAHLVTINDAKEQKWLGAVFGNEFYWIGLSDTKIEGKWQWHNGEPLTYQDWLPDDYFYESQNAEERDFAVATFADGKWYAVSPKSVIVRMTQMAIIEKADIKINTTKEK